MTHAAVVHVRVEGTTTLPTPPLSHDPPCPVCEHPTHATTCGHPSVVGGCDCRDVPIPGLAVS